MISMKGTFPLAEFRSGRSHYTNFGILKPRGELNVSPKDILCFFAIALTAISGCGVRGVSGGTKGTLRSGGELLSEIQVTVYRVEGDSKSPVGFGVTAPDGSFQLVTNGAKGPLWLSPGEYCCTVESAGAPVQFPQEYAQPSTTPLKISCSASDATLNLEAPLRPTAR